MKLVVLMTSRTEDALEVAQDWQEAGATGVTILEGYGLRRLQENMGIRDDLPLVPSLSALLEREEISTVLLLSMVKDNLVQQMYRMTVERLGDLTLPQNGLLFTIPVSDLIGMGASGLDA